MNKIVNGVVATVLGITDAAGALSNTLQPNQYSPVDQGSDWISLQSDSNAERTKREIDSGRNNPWSSK